MPPNMACSSQGRIAVRQRTGKHAGHKILLEEQGTLDSAQPVMHHSVHTMLDTVLRESAYPDDLARFKIKGNHLRLLTVNFGSHVKIQRLRQCQVIHLLLRHPRFLSLVGYLRCPVFFVGAVPPCVAGPCAYAGSCRGHALRHCCKVLR